MTAFLVDRVIVLSQVTLNEVKVTVGKSCLSSGQFVSNIVGDLDIEVAICILLVFEVHEERVETCLNILVVYATTLSWEEGLLDTLLYVNCTGSSATP